MRTDMKTKTYIITLLLTIAAASACSREKLDPTAENTPAAVETGSQVLVPFTVEAGEPQTRVAMDGSTNNIVFSAGDQLMVYFFQLVEPSILTLKSGAGQRSATFTGNLILAEGKTEADLAGKRLFAVLIPAAGVSSGVFTYDPSTKKLSVDYSAGAIDSDLEALVSRTILYQGETTYEARKFSFRMLNSYVKMDVTVPSEESDLARDYTVSVTNDWHICAKATCSRSGWSASGEASAVSGTFTASSAKKGTLYMSVLSDNMVRITDDGAQYDQVDFSIAMDNVYKEYDLQGGSISKAIIEPGKGYTKSVTLRDNPSQDVLKGQPESVRTRILSKYRYDLDSNGYLSKYEAAQVKTCQLYGNEDLTDASFFNYFTGMTTLPTDAFKACSNLTKVLLPPNLTAIENSVFVDCAKLSQDINIPQGVTSIGRSAFNGCSTLPRIVIPSGVTTIGEFAFQDCSALTEVIFVSPVRVTSIGAYAFSKCASLEGIAIPSKVTTIEKRTFEGCTSLRTVVNTVNVTSIGEYAFFNCKSLGEIRVPRVTSIGKFAFSDATSLQSVYLPTGLFSSIEEGTFYGCTSLVNIPMPASLETIGTSAFRDCSSLVEITIPGGVTSMGAYAFYGTTKLTTVYCYPTTPPSIDFTTFYQYSSGLTIYVPKDSFTTYRLNEDWNRYYVNDILKPMS